VRGAAWDVCANAQNAAAAIRVAAVFFIDAGKKDKE
jgi:hypothetical protein